jgi:hypothetical protein
MARSSSTKAAIRHEQTQTEGFQFVPGEAGVVALSIRVFGKTGAEAGFRNEKFDEVFIVLASGSERLAESLFRLDLSSIFF